MALHPAPFFRLLRLAATGSALALTCAGILSAHDRITTKVTWEREIAPIVRARCASCHSPGGRAPMPLTTYDEARPWAKAIKEEVLARRMPKWHVVRGYGDFTNDPSLSAFEIALIAAWADGGAPAKSSAQSVSSFQFPVSSRTHEVKKIPTQSVTRPCVSPLPAGRIVGLKPVLSKGESLRLTLVHADKREEPLLWLQNFDPTFEETYWLRNPIRVARGARLRGEGAPSCSLTVLLESRTGK